ncbi:unnamed protein product [Thelazia callipaeda]|uniref:Ovule protein n=1 Tax=Thelazia callipaeda TaxID=103827 RepID=A0A0N5CM07_THECL|nr:unnamed protein product [Thelazia callipaeda]
MKVNGGNTSVSSCDNNRNGIDSQQRQNDGNGSSTREHSSIQGVSEGPSTSQDFKKRKEVTDHYDSAHATPCCSISEVTKTKQGKKVKKNNTHCTNKAEEKPVAKRDRNRKKNAVCSYSQNIKSSRRK